MCGVDLKARRFYPPPPAFAWVGLSLSPRLYSSRILRFLKKPASASPCTAVACFAVLLVGLSKDLGAELDKKSAVVPKSLESLLWIPKAESSRTTELKSAPYFAFGYTTSLTCAFNLSGEFSSLSTCFLLF